jgi:hypothetical protein
MPVAGVEARGVEPALNGYVACDSAHSDCALSGDRETDRGFGAGFDREAGAICGGWKLQEAKRVQQRRSARTEVCGVILVTACGVAPCQRPVSGHVRGR